MGRNKRRKREKPLQRPGRDRIPSQEEAKFVETVSRIMLLVEVAGDLDTLLRLDQFKNDPEELIEGFRDLTPRRYGGRNDDPDDNARWEALRQSLLTDPRMASLVPTLRRAMQEQIMEQLEKATP